MALMTSIRNRMHIVLWGLLAMFLLSMTIGGLVGGANIIDQILGRVNPNTTIARINDQDISPDQFQNLVSQELQQIRSSGQQVNDLHIQRARNSAWDNLVQDILITQEVDRLGINASDEEVLYHLENNPPPFLQQNPEFHTDGIFDINKYKSILAEPQGNEWAPIESFMKTTYIPNFKLQQYLDQSIIITDTELLKEFIIRNVNYTINAIHITNKTVSSESIEPTDLELKNEYENSLKDFEMDELRTIKYCFWKKEPSKLDSTNILSLANQITNLAKSGENFSALANEHSQDPGNQGNNGGDLGWFKKGRMVKPFEDAAFEADIGQIVGPVKSSFGYHIIYVRDKKYDKNRIEEILASHILLKIETSSTTLSNLKRLATLFSYDAQDFGFVDAADSSNLEIHTQEKLNENSFSIQNIGYLRSAIQFAFRSETGSISDIFENDQYFAICYLDSIIPPGIAPFKEVKSKLRKRIIKRKEKSATLDIANSILVDITAKNNSLSNFANNDLEIDEIKNETKTLNQGFSSINRSNYIVGSLLSANPGDLLGPIETSRGHALVELVDVSVLDSTEFEVQKETLKKNIFSRKQSQFFQSWLDDLKLKANIIDNRKFYF
ncbi:MAG: hypothetical protein CMG74_11090 [Candidatus Marinimicrobia bacterium]|nr:hypothetical protein [Candidatus Neomarinimicrobiota bacterium]|tara:strand:+ start:3487 stop:5319 length:1833 start_codon:yes stop_codon:yes gene_type:complete